MGAIYTYRSLILLQADDDFLAVVGYIICSSAFSCRFPSSHSF